MDGAIRDAMTSIYNLEILLKSPRISTRLLHEVAPEVKGGLAALRSAFVAPGELSRDVELGDARRALASFTNARLDEIERATDQAVASDFDPRGRITLEQAVGRVKSDLDAAVELLDLGERARHSVEAELPFEQLLVVALSDRARPPGPEVLVRVVQAAPSREPEQAQDSRGVRADPHVFKRLVAHSIARAQAEGAPELSIRARLAPHAATFEIGPAAEAERSVRTMALRLAKRIPPTDALVEAAGRVVGVAVKWDPDARVVVLEIPTPPPSCP
jgi:hypothetical protein